MEFYERCQNFYHRQRRRPFSPEMLALMCVLSGCDVEPSEADAKPTETQPVALAARNAQPGETHSDGWGSVPRGTAVVVSHRGQQREGFLISVLDGGTLRVRLVGDEASFRDLPVDTVRVAE